MVSTISCASSQFSCGASSRHYTGDTVSTTQSRFHLCWQKREESLLTTAIHIARWCGSGQGVGLTTFVHTHWSQSENKNTRNTSSPQTREGKHFIKAVYNYTGAYNRQVYYKLYSITISSVVSTWKTAGMEGSIPVTASVNNQCVW